MTATTVTPPIVLARRARHRKPNRRRGVIAKVGGSLLLAAAISAGVATAAPGNEAPAFYGITPGQASKVAAALAAPGWQLTSRPVWDGRGTYASGVEPLCPASLAGRTARAGSPGHLFTVTCERDGDEYMWTVAR